MPKNWQFDGGEEVPTQINLASGSHMKYKSAEKSLMEFINLIRHQLIKPSHWKNLQLVKLTRNSKQCMTLFNNSIQYNIIQFNVIQYITLQNNTI